MQLRIQLAYGLIALMVIIATFATITLIRRKRKRDAVRFRRYKR